MTVNPRKFPAPRPLFVFVPCGTPWRYSMSRDCSKVQMSRSWQGVQWSDLHICSRSLRFCLEKLTSAVHWQGHISDTILLQDLRRIFFHLRTDYNLMNGGVRVRSPHSAQVLLVCSKRELLGNDSFIWTAVLVRERIGESMCMVHCRITSRLGSLLYFTVQLLQWICTGLD